MKTTRNACLFIRAASYVERPERLTSPRTGDVLSAQGFMAVVGAVLFRLARLLVSYWLDTIYLDLLPGNRRKNWKGYGKGLPSRIDFPLPHLGTHAPCPYRCPSRPSGSDPTGAVVVPRGNSATRPQLCWATEDGLQHQQRRAPLSGACSLLPPRRRAEANRCRRVSGGPTPSHIRESYS